MIGILLLSHGKMAEGMLDSCNLFFHQPEKIRAIGLAEGAGVDEFDREIIEAIDEIDDGSGVVVLADLFGGTPSNRCLYLLAQQKHIKVITGMNFSMLLELLGVRQSISTIEELDVKALVDIGINGIKDLEDELKKLLSEGE